MTAAYSKTAFLSVAALKVKILSSDFDGVRQMKTATAEVKEVILRGM